MKLDYIFISFLAFLSVPACYGDLQESQKEELYYFLKENRERLPIALFLQKMYDLQINETARERMIQEMIPLWDEKNRKSQDLVNVIAKTLLKDYAPLGKRTYSQYQGLENQPVPEWLDMDEGDDVIALENKSDKNLPKSNHEEKEEQKEENSLFKNRQVNKIQEVTELMENMILENKSDKKLPKSNQGKKREEKAKQKKENSLFKNSQGNKIQEVTKLLSNMTLD